MIKTHAELVLQREQNPDRKLRRSMSLGEINSSKEIIDPFVDRCEIAQSKPETIQSKKDSLRTPKKSNFVSRLTTSPKLIFTKSKSKTAIKPFKGTPGTPETPWTAGTRNNGETDQSIMRISQSRHTKRATDLIYEEEEKKSKLRRSFSLDTIPTPIPLDNHHTDTVKHMTDSTK